MLHDTATVAKMLNLKRRRVQQLFQAEIIPGEKIGRDYFATKQAVQEALKWLQKHGRNRKSSAA